MHSPLPRQNQGMKVPEMSTPVQSPMSDAVVARGVSTADQGEGNKTIWWWVGFFAVFVVWGWIQNREKITTELQPRNIHANLHNLAVITFAAVIGIVGGQVLFTKLAALTSRVPGVNRVTSYIAQLFSAA